jgi:putative zinc finger/helix-turn-helix YgiT family protein
MTRADESLFHYTDCGLSKVYLKGITIYHCTNSDCGEEEIIIPNMEELHQRLAEKVASAPMKLRPEEIRFLRTHLGFSGAEFAKSFGVSAETVSRWEKGSVNMKEASERLLRVLVLSKFGPFRNYEDLKEFATVEKKTPHKHVFKASRNNWAYDEAA